jgi:hypothetical protein
MRTRLRLGAAAAVGLGALLLATVLASPALAWHSTVEAEASCLPDGGVLVEFTVTPFQDDHEATVDVFYVLNDDKPIGLVSEGNLSKTISGEFDLPPGSTGKPTVVALVHWEKTGEKTTDKVHVDLPKCEEETTTPTAPPTTEAAVGGATSTTSGGQLPFTGAGSSGPMLLAGIGLVAGGALVLLVSRIKDRHAA